MHGDVAEHLGRGILAAGYEQDAGFAVVVHVPGGRSVDTDHLRQHDLFADLVDHFLVRFAKCPRVVVGRRLVKQGIGPVGSGSVQQLPGAVFGQGPEFVVVGHRCRLALQFDHCRRRSVVGDGDGDTTFGGGVIGPLEHHLLVLFLEDLDRLLLVAVGFDQRLFAFHHRQVGQLSQFLDLCGSDIRHRESPRVNSACVR